MSRAKNNQAFSALEMLSSSKKIKLKVELELSGAQLEDAKLLQENDLLESCIVHLLTNATGKVSLKSVADELRKRNNNNQVDIAKSV